MGDRPANDSVYCPSCGYDLRGIDTSERCPECGLPIDRTAPAGATVPWARRAHLGKRRAYRKTVRLAMLRPTRMATAAAPLRWDDARAFRRRTARRAAVPLAAAVLLLYATTAVFASRPRGMSGVTYLLRQALQPLGMDWLVAHRIVQVTSVAFAAEIVVLLVTLASTYLAALAVASFAGCFFDRRELPDERRDRAAALGAYACAPLAWMPLATVPLLGAAFEFVSWCAFRVGFDRQAAPYWVDTFPRLTRVALPLAAVPVVWTWVTTLVLFRRATGHGAARVLALAALLPVSSIALPVLIVGGTFAGALLVAMAVVSLT
jgi:hypothetical protein